MQRIRELDALRGIAALAVALFHLTYWYDPYHVAPLRLAWGHYGVELFFVISGFVIFMTIERCEQLGDFIASRFARLFPAYWLAVLITAVVAWSAAPRWDSAPPTIAQVLVNLTMLQRFVMVPEVDNSYWTPAIELSFYVAMGSAAARAALDHYGERRNLGPISAITGLYYERAWTRGPR